MLCIIVILKNKFLWLFFFFFNDVIPFISVCWHSDRCFIQMFRTVSRVPLNREHRFKQKTDRDVCVHVFWLFVTAVQRLRAVCSACHSSWEAVWIRAVPTESSVITAATTGTSCVAVLFISVLFVFEGLLILRAVCKIHLSNNKSCSGHPSDTISFLFISVPDRASPCAHYVWRALLH